MSLLRKVGLPVPRHNGTCRRYGFLIGSTTEFLIASVLLDVVKAIGCLSQILSFDSIPIRSRASKDIRFSTRRFLVPKMEISKSQLVFSPPPESPHKPPCSQTSYDGFVSLSSLPFLRLHLHTRRPFSGSDRVDFHSTEPWLLTGFYNIYNRETGRSKHLKSQCVVSNSSRTQE